MQRKNRQKALFLNETVLFILKIYKNNWRFKGYISKLYA